MIRDGVGLVDGGAQRGKGFRRDCDRDRRSVKRRCQLHVASIVRCMVVRHTGRLVALARSRVSLRTPDRAIAPVEALLGRDDHGAEQRTGIDREAGGDEQDRRFQVVDDVGDRIADAGGV